MLEQTRCFRGDLPLAGLGKARHVSTFWRTSLMIDVGSYCCSLVERPFPSSKTISSCCFFRFFGFGIGVMNSALRRLSMIF